MKTVATIGFFDGVHRGHQFVLQQVLNSAANLGARALAVTFSQHPRSLLSSEYVPQLLTLPEERVLLLKRQGVEVLELDFSQIYQLTARAFMCMLRDEYGVCELILGYDHHFGSDNLSDISDYKHIGSDLGMEVKQLPQLDGCYHISSSEIRGLLGLGEVSRANDLLGHPYVLSGEVISGNGIGRTIGFPTANLQIAESKLLPRDGVYSAMCCQGCVGKKALINIGTNPTIGNQVRTVEAHLIDAKGDFYGQVLSFELVDFIRNEKHFPTVCELKKQIESDVRSLYAK